MEHLDADAMVDSFIELGCCVVRRAFSREQAERATQCLWRRMAQKADIWEDKPSTWPTVYDIEEHLANREVLECFTDRLASAVELLLGPGRWCGIRRWGLWPVNFSNGANRPWGYPTSGWHVDGNFFRHTIDCPKQGLLVIGLFTDIQPRGGGTVLALGSHKMTARALARHPEGLTHRELFDEVLAEPIGNFHEITGEAGDVFLAHPFLFHARGFKHRGGPRIISNSEAPLLEPMNLHRDDPKAYSPLEASIIRALEEPPQAPAVPRMCRFEARQGDYQ